MSSSGQPRFRDVKTSTPPSAHPAHVGSLGPRLNNYSLNLKGGQTPAATYKVPQPKKIGPVKLWIRRNPRRFHFLFVTVSLSIFFSRPLYDIFVRPAVERPKPKEKALGQSL